MTWDICLSRKKVRNPFTYLLMRPSGSMCAMMKPVVPLLGLRFFEMIIPNSSVGAFRSLSILNDLDVRDGNIDGGEEVSEKLVGGSTDDVGGLVLSWFLSDFSAWEDCESV